MKYVCVCVCVFIVRDNQTVNNWQITVVESSVDYPDSVIKGNEVHMGVTV